MPGNWSQVSTLVKVSFKFGFPEGQAGQAERGKTNILRADYEGDFLKVKQDWEETKSIKTKTM